MQKDFGVFLCMQIIFSPTVETVYYLLHHLAFDILELGALHCKHGNHWVCKLM